MTMTNYGNKYKFKAIMKRRSNQNPETVTVQFIKKDGTWGKPCEIKKVTCMTDEEFVEYLAEINHKAVRIAEKEC